jgi:hypothetical protein
MRLKEFPPGSLQHQPAEPGRELSNRTSHVGDATITVTDAEIPQKPAMFRVTFFISFAHGSVVPEEHDHLHLTIQLPGDNADQSYREVEEQAARRVPGVLRSLAVAVEQDIARTDRERAAKAG